ncbi:MAG: exodeoxyribonuclease VII large subunit [Actinomycetota bacterium]
MALETSAEHPVPVRTVSRLLADWIGRLGRVWVEGQVTQVSRRPGAGMVFLTLRDPVADVSLQVTCPRAAYDALVPPLSDGARVVVHARPELFLARGSLSLAATEIRPVGVGELLARLERLRRTLAAEGLFAAERKRPLPFLPEVVGLVCGRGSAAEHDVLENTRRRWPSVRFRVCNVAVQGPYAVTEVVGALRELDADPAVEVIVVARGGGSVEDLLPFSDETLLRAVAACRTPVVSAIGHEQDAPLLDLVADARASTPTDAAKRVVPDVAEQRRLVADLRARGRRAVAGRLDREAHLLTGLRSRPVLARPLEGLDQRAAEVAGLRERARRSFTGRLDRAADDLAHCRGRIGGLSPQATLARGYAVLQRADGTVVRQPGQVAPGEALTARLAEGRLGLTVGPAAG